MSAQSTKKKRIGSRRRLANLSETSVAGDGFHITDRQHVLEENTESLIGMADTSHSESQHPSSPEVKRNRRKFGSSRRNIGRQPEGSARESYQESIEEGVENTSINDALLNQNITLLPGNDEMESTSYQPQDFMTPDLSFIQFIQSEKQTDDTKPANECNDHRSTENMTTVHMQNESLREESASGALIDDGSIKQRLDEQAVQDEPATKMPSAMKTTAQQRLNQASEHNIMSVKHDSSIPDYAVEVPKSTQTNRPEPVLESTFTKTENLEEDHHDRENDGKVEFVDCEFFDNTQEGMDKSHTLHSEDDSDQLKANAHCVDISQLATFTSHSVSPVDLLLNEHSNSKEMADEELTHVYSVMDQEDKKIDEDTELLRQSGKLQANCLVSESHIKVGEAESAIKLVTTAEKSHPGESTENETIVEQTKVPSPTVEIPTNVNRDEHEVEAAQQSEMHEQEAQATHRQEMHQIHSFSECVSHDATESLNVSFGNSRDEVKICDTQQSESTLETVKSGIVKQELSNPDNKEAENSANQSNFEDVGQRNEDDCYDSTDNIENVDTALGLVSEGEGQAEEDANNIGEQTLHQENDRLLSEDVNSKSSLQTLQSEINAPLYSKPQENSVRTEDQTETSSKTAEEITKMNSSEKYIGCEEENTEKMQDEGTVVSQNDNNDNSPTVTITEITAHSDSLKSTVESNEKDNLRKMTEVPENGSQITEYEEFEKMESQQSPEVSFCKSDCQMSDTQNISYHNDDVNLRSSPVDVQVLDQGEILQVQNMDAMSIDEETPREEIHMTESDNVIDTVECEKIKDLTENTEDCDTEAESLTDVRLSAKDEVTEQCGDPTKADHVAQETNALHETYSEMFPTTENEMIVSDALAAFDIHHEENIKKEFPEPAVECKSAISNTDDVCESQEGLLDKTQNGDNSENVLKSKQNRRKMGSTRKIHRKQEEEMDNKDEKEGDMRSQRPSEAELKMQVEHKCSASDLHVVLEEKNVDDEAREMTQTYVSMKENNHQTENKETVNVNPHENTSNEEVGGFFLTCKSVMTDNEEMINNDPKPENTIDSALSLLSKKDEVPEATLNEKIEVVEESSVIVTAEASQYGNTKTSTSGKCKEQEQDVNETMNKQKQGSNTSDLLSTESRRSSGLEDSAELFPGYSGSPAASHSEEAADALVFVQQAVVRDDEGNVDNVVSVAPSQLGDFTVTETDTSVLAESSSCSISELLPLNTVNTEPSITGRRSVDLCETTKSRDKDLKAEEAHDVTIVDLEIVGSEVKGGPGEKIKNILTDIQEPNNTSEEAHSTNTEIRNASPHSNSANRRRKMGSTRRNLTSKGEDLHRKQEDNEAAVKDVGDEMSESVSSVKEKESQLQSEHKYEEQEKENVKEHGHTDSQSESMSLQSVEENPVTHVQMVETEHHLSPHHLPPTPAVPPQHDVLSELLPEGRRRKMGSHRKLRGHQNYQNYDDPNACEDKVTGTSDGRDPESLDKQSEVEESDNRPSSNVNTFTTAEPSTPMGLLDKKEPVHVTPVQHPDPEVHHQKTEKRHSFSGNSKGSDLRPNGYNLIMIGDSSVGKTSFMKRVQSGTFSSDLCASVGIDSCTTTVTVDGKTVALHLWDTAGQERFHSITRQLFHKAQAFLLMYDITSSQSFSAIRYWLDCIQEGATGSVIIMLLGNKCDCAERQVQSQEGEILAKEYNFAFMECSAATGENVTRSLETVTRMLGQKADTKEEGVVLHKEPQQKKTSGCC